MALRTKRADQGFPNRLLLLAFLVELDGIEPTTS
jgi:hypothetical protein